MPIPRLNPREVRLLGVGASVAIEPVQRRPRKPSEVGQLFPRSTRVLGLDLAIVTTGFALIDGGKLHAAGSIKLGDSPRARETRPAFILRRSAELYRDIKGLVDEYEPAVIAYEYPDVARPHYSGGTKGREFLVARALGQAEVMLVLAVANMAPTLVSVPMTAAKRRLTGRPGATKGQIRDAVARIVGQGVVEQLTDDQSDAISIAYAVLED